MKAVFDTNVLVSALFWRGTPHHCFLAAQAGLFELIISDEILNELRRVLSLKLRLPPPEVEEAIKSISAVAQRADVTETVIRVREDPADDKFLSVAVSAKADFVVSGDKHLLRIGEFREIRIISTSHFFIRVQGEGIG